MRWPWTARVEAAEKRAEDFKATVARLELEAERRDVAADGRTEQIAELRNQLAESKADNKILIDRIVQMSGQPPIFHPAPIQATPPAPSPQPQVSTMPGPETRVSFADVHRETRKAIKNGDIGLLTRVG
jgi:hypothetical protein